MAAKNKIDILITAQDKASKALKAVGKQADKTESAFKKLSVGSTLSLGLALTSLGFAARKAIKELTGFETAMAEVSTLVDTSTTDMGRLTDAVLDLSTKVPKSAIDISKGLYQTISAGVTDAADAMQLLDVATRSATAGVTDTNTAVDAITTIINAYGKSVDEAEDISDVLFTTIREGKTTFPELAQNIGMVVSSAALAGVEVDELGASFATMTKAGINTAETATALNRLFLTLANPTEGIKKKTRAMGVEFSAAALRAKGFSGFMSELVPKLLANKDAIFELGLDMRAFKGLAVLGGTGAEEFARQIENMTTRTGAQNTAFEKMNQTATSQWQIFKNQFNVALQATGEVILPVATGALVVFNDTLEETKKVSEDIPFMTRFNIAMGKAISNMVGFVPEAIRVNEQLNKWAENMNFLPSSMADLNKELETFFSFEDGEDPLDQTKLTEADKS